METEQRGETEKKDKNQFLMLRLSLWKKVNFVLLEIQEEMEAMDLVAATGEMVETSQSLFKSRIWTFFH